MGVGHHGSQHKDHRGPDECVEPQIGKASRWGNGATNPYKLGAAGKLSGSTVGVLHLLHSMHVYNRSQCDYRPSGMCLSKARNHVYQVALQSKPDVLPELPEQMAPLRLLPLAQILTEDALALDDSGPASLRRRRHQAHALAVRPNGRDVDVLGLAPQHIISDGVAGVADFLGSVAEDVFAQDRNRRVVPLDLVPFPRGWREDAVQRRQDDRVGVFDGLDLGTGLSAVRAGSLMRMTY